MPRAIGPPILATIPMRSRGIDFGAGRAQPSGADVGDPRGRAPVAGDQLVIAWEGSDRRLDRSGPGVLARRFSIDGKPLGPEFRVNQTTVADQEGPSLAPLADGGFVAAYRASMHLRLTLGEMTAEEKRPPARRVGAGRRPPRWQTQREAGPWGGGESGRIRRS